MYRWKSKKSKLSQQLWYIISREDLNDEVRNKVNEEFKKNMEETKKEYPFKLGDIIFKKILEKADHEKKLLINMIVHS